MGLTFHIFGRQPLYGVATLFTPIWVRREFGLGRSGTRSRLIRRTEVYLYSICHEWRTITRTCYRDAKTAHHPDNVLDWKAKLETAVDAIEYDSGFGTGGVFNYTLKNSGHWASFQKI